MRRILLLIVSLSFTGCGGDGRPTTLPVEIIATYKGQPATGALIVLHPVDAAREKFIGGKPFGKVKDDGTVAVTMYAQGDGAPEGEYAITVQWLEASKAKLSLTEEGGSSKDKLGGRYADPRAPKVKITVAKGSPNKLELKLE